MRTQFKVQPRVEVGRIEAAPQGTDAAEFRPLAHREAGLDRQAGLRAFERADEALRASPSRASAQWVPDLGPGDAA
jgi:hypothetical protein